MQRLRASREQQQHAGFVREVVAVPGDDQRSVNTSCTTSSASWVAQHVRAETQQPFAPG
jgi:hypothetical protein